MTLLKVGALLTAVVIAAGALWFGVVVSTDDPGAGSTEALEVLGPIFFVIVFVPLIWLGILLAWVTEAIHRGNEKFRREAEAEGWEGFRRKTR